MRMLDTDSCNFVPMSEVGTVQIDRSRATIGFTKFSRESGARHLAERGEFSFLTVCSRGANPLYPNLRPATCLHRPTSAYGVKLWRVRVADLAEEIRTLSSIDDGLGTNASENDVRTIHSVVPANLEDLRHF